MLAELSAWLLPSAPPITTAKVAAPALEDEVGDAPEKGRGRPGFSAALVC